MAGSSICHSAIKNDSGAILSGERGNVVCHETVMNAGRELAF